VSHPRLFIRTNYSISLPAERRPRKAEEEETLRREEGGREEGVVPLYMTFSMHSSHLILRNETCSQQ